MPKLTKEQIRFLTWLSFYNHNFDICRQNCKAYGRYNGLQTYVDDIGSPFKFDIRTLNKLLDEKLVITQFIFPLGVKWESYSLTEKGEVLVLLLSASKDGSWPQLRKHK